MPCACTFAQAPDEDECDGILAWHVNEGNYGDVKLDDLNVVAVGSFEGNIWAGEAKNSRMGFFIDERADESQREALQAIFGGDAGGWPAGFAELIEDLLGIEYAPIDFEIADDLTSWRVEVPGKARGRAEALSGTDQFPTLRSRFTTRPAPRSAPDRSRHTPRRARTRSTHSA